MYDFYWINRKKHIENFCFSSALLWRKNNISLYKKTHFRQKIVFPTVSLPPGNFFVLRGEVAMRQ